MRSGYRKALIKGGGASLLVFVPLLLALLGSWDPDPRLQRINFVEWEEIQRSHEGEVLAVYVWASWCRTCVELFPAVVQLQREYEGRAQFVTLSLDDPGDVDSIANANQLLIANQAHFAHYLLDEDFPDALDHLDIPKIPAAVVFGTGGHRRFVLLGDELENELSLADIQDAVDSLIDES